MGSEQVDAAALRGRAGEERDVRTNAICMILHVLARPGCAPIGFQLSACVFCLLFWLRHGRHAGRPGSGGTEGKLVAAVRMCVRVHTRARLLSFAREGTKARLCGKFVYTDDGAFPSCCVISFSARCSPQEFHIKAAYTRPYIHTSLLNARE